MFEIPMPISQNFHILNSNRSPIGCRRTIMIAISEEEESLIDNIGDRSLAFHRGDKSFSVKRKDVYCYGEVDFKDKDTLDAIDKFKFLDYLGAVGVHIYSKYDYDKHCCYSPMRRAMWTETWSPADLAKYAHGCLKKPERILLFNETIK